MVYPFAGTFLGVTLAEFLKNVSNLPNKPNVIIIPGNNNQDKLIPVSKCADIKTCLANTDILNPDLISGSTINPVLFRVQIGLSVAGVFSVVIKQGVNSSVYSLNSGIALTANSLYVFDILVHPEDKINFRSSLAGSANMRIQEISIGVQ